MIAAVAYDLFRLPFVYANAWGIAGVVPLMPLFKVFPRFGAMILGEPLEQTGYSTLAQAVGWTYHFGNGLGFGVMYVAMIGDPRRCSWLWAVVVALAIEACMLVSPYAKYFSITMDARFVVVTVAAHAVFGVALGLACLMMARLPGLAAAATVSAHSGRRG